MRNTTNLILLGLLVTAGVLVAGCSGDEDSVNGSGTAAQAPQIVSVYPADGATGVDPATNMHVVFSDPMDTASVRRAFYFTGGAPMHDWMDSLQHHTGGMGGNMGGQQMMDMTHMMSWMDSIAFPGQFMWNDSLDSCSFVPDTTLMPNTDHMMLFYGDLMDRQGHARHMQEMPVDSVIWRFVTGL